MSLKKMLKVAMLTSSMVAGSVGSAYASNVPLYQSVVQDSVFVTFVKNGFNLFTSTYDGNSSSGNDVLIPQYVVLPSNTSEPTVVQLNTLFITGPIVGTIQAIHEGVNLIVPSTAFVGAIGTSATPINELILVSKKGARNNLTVVGDIYLDNAFVQNSNTRFVPLPLKGNTTSTLHGNYVLVQDIPWIAPELHIASGTSFVTDSMDMSNIGPNGSVVVTIGQQAELNLATLKNNKNNDAILVIQPEFFPKFVQANFITIGNAVDAAGKEQLPLITSGNAFFDYQVSSGASGPIVIGVIPKEGFADILAKKFGNNPAFQKFATAIQEAAMLSSQNISDSSEIQTIVDQDGNEFKIPPSFLEIGYMNAQESRESVAQLAEGIPNPISATINVANRILEVACPIVGVFESIFGSEGSLGQSAGDDLSKKTVWMHGFMGLDNQKSRKETSGYKSKMHGGILGVNTNISDDTLLGAAFSVTKTIMKHQGNKNGSKSNVDTYGLSFYAHHDFANNWIMQGALSAGKNFFHGKEKHLVARNGAYAFSSSKYNNMSYHTQLLGGYNHKISNNFVITPMVGLSYATASKISYTEKDVGQRNRTITSKATKSFSGTLGSKLTMAHKFDKTQVVTGLKAFVEYDFTAKGTVNTVMMGGFSSPVETFSAKPPRFSYKLGADVMAENHVVEYGVGYDLSLASKYIGHQGSLKIKVKL